MKKLFVAAMLSPSLLNFMAVGQIPSDANLRIQIGNLSATNFSGIVSNTQSDIEYEIQGKQSQTNWMSIGFILGSETTNWTPFDFRITNAVNSKMIRVRSWIDSQGVSIPDWWQLKYFGKIGIDPYDDPDKDGYNNMEEFNKGTDPTVFNSPPKGVANIEAKYTVSNGETNVVVQWNSPSPSVTSYTILRVDNGITNFYTVGGAVTLWMDTNPPSPVDFHYRKGERYATKEEMFEKHAEAFGKWKDAISYRIVANYSNNPAASDPDSNPNYNPRLAVP